MPMLVRCLASLLLLMLLAAPPAGLAQAPRPHFYIFGSETCPYCIHLKEDLIKAYGEESVTFLEVSKPENGEKFFAAFRAVYPDVEIAGVPLTVVVVEGRAVACALGDLRLDAWRRLIDEAVKTGAFLRMSLNGSLETLTEDRRLIVERVLGIQAPADQIGDRVSARDPPGVDLIVLTLSAIAILMAILFLGRKPKIFKHFSVKRRAIAGSIIF